MTHDPMQEERYESRSVHNWALYQPDPPRRNAARMLLAFTAIVVGVALAKWLGVL